MSAIPIRRRRAPGPRGSFVMGNLAEYKRDPISMLLKLQHEYGDIARNRLGPFLTHALAHPQHVQYVLQDNHRNYVRGRFYDNFKLFFGDGLLTTDGDFWRRHRRSVQPVFHKKHIEGSTAAIGRAVLRMIEHWNGEARGKAIDVVPEMMHLSLGVLGEMMFNTDISRHAEEVGPLVRFGLEAMMPQGSLNDFLPRWAPTPFNWRVRRARRGIDRIIAQVINDHREGVCETSDIISLLLAARHPDTGAPMTEQEVHDEVMTVFLAGHETTGSGLAWALYALAQHPAILRLLREELDAKLGGRPPTVEDLETLPYLDQVVNEALRVYPPIWGYTRDLVEDDEIAGFEIPAGSAVFMSPYVTHRHPEFWSNPEAFDPENFGTQAPERHKFAFFPFGGGMRKCIGYQVALLIMRVLVATVAQHLDLHLLPGHPIVRGALISLRPLEGILMTLKRRDRSRFPGPVPLLPTFPQAAVAEYRTQDHAGGVAASCPFQAGRPTGSDTIRTASRPGSPDLAEPSPCGAGTDASPRPALSRPSVGPAIDFAASHRRPPAATEGGAVPTLRFTWFAVEVEAPPETPSAALVGKRIVVVNGRSAAAERVALALARACAKAWIFTPTPGEDVAAAARALISENGPIDGIVDLGLQAPFSLENAADWEAPIRRTLGLLHACYDDWLSEESTSRLFYLAVTWMDGRMGYGGGSSAASPGSPAASEQPLGGIWSGLAKTLPQELPNCNVRVMDLAPDEADAVERRVVAELYRWGLFEIGWCGGRRYTLQAERDDLRPGQAPPAGPGDILLFSGGARGIGLLCARAIAERYGATVIVTGREQPARGFEPWARLDESGFKLYAREQIALATQDRPPVSIRREMDRLQRRRDLRRQLEDLACSGLPIHYRVCDVTDAEAVRALCDEIGSSLRFIVHNAGIDQPVRLAQKTAESFIDTVRTKVLGFAHLCAAATDRPDLLQFCSVGSLTGRLGGMTGETDYAAANEALARLGSWAARHALSCTVKTLAWPTWEAVGMITNFDVTKRYVSPMRVAEGVRHWLAELGDSRSGEVMFMGAVGRAVTPIQINGFSPIYGLPDISGLIFRHHHAGEPLRFRPFSRFVTRYRIPPRQAPFLRAFCLDDRPSLPSAMLIEHACGVGGWVIPEGFRPMHLTGLANIRVQLDACVLPPADGDGPVEILSEAVGYRLGTDWMVDVRSTLTASRREVLRLTLVHREAPPSATLQPMRLDPAGRPDLAPLPPVLRPAWNRHLLGRTEWQVLRDGATSVRAARAAPVDAADLWAVPYPPPLLLPINHMETILHAVWAGCRGGLEAALSTWFIESIEFGDIPSAAAERVIELCSGHFSITDRNGLVVMEVRGAAVLSQDDDGDEKNQPADPVAAAMQEAGVITSTIGR